MGLPQSFAYDTETDRKDKDDWECTKNCLVQVCSTTAASKKEVILYEGEDSIDQFLRAFEDTAYDCDCHAFNLGNYEYRWLKFALLRNGYVYTRAKRPKPKEFAIWGDRSGVYKMLIVNADGYRMTVTDDMKRFMGAPMKDIAQMVKDKHPDWFGDIVEVKEHVDYNNGWYYYGHQRDVMLSYARQDVFSQAMIARYCNEENKTQFLTLQSQCMHETLCMKYGKDKNDPKNRRYAKMDFRKEYPVLDQEMQLIAEENLLGGYVWGNVGHHRGTFCHVDYKSSYPYEYAYGRMFRGKVCRMKRSEVSDEAWERVKKGNFMRWLIVSFDFKIKEHGAPCISAHECRKKDRGSLKMSKGRIEKRLYTESYFYEIARNYDVWNVKVDEIWYAKPMVGGFEEVTRFWFEQKEEASRLLAMGDRSQAIRKMMAKAGLNGSEHGKTITKTLRLERHVGEDGEDVYEWVQSEAEYNFMIGFTGMMNARERIVREVRKLQENDVDVMMCDTDSIVAKCNMRRMVEILGTDRFTVGGDMMYSLGKFEFEKDKYGNLHFDEFKCWGLKRYCELNKGMYRKSAFAGMHEEHQKRILPTHCVSHKLTCWKQQTKKRIAEGNTICEGVKSFSAYDVWYHDEDEIDIEEIEERIRRVSYAG